MKRSIFALAALVATLFAACSTDATQDLAPKIPTSPDELYVSFDEESRVQLNAECKTVWTKDDLVSVFYYSDANDCWRFKGETGDRNGLLIRKTSATPTVATDEVVVVYPYNADYRIATSDKTLSVRIPAVQHYEAGSYGVGANLMVSTGTSNNFSLKSVCGWIKLQFTGSSKITKITLRGNDDEQIAGLATINYADYSLSLIADGLGDAAADDEVGGTLVDDADYVREVTLDCGEGIALNSETPTAFYIALPPQTFEKGLTATMYGIDGTTKEISTKNTITIERNHIVPMASIALEMPIANNEIWYTSSDGNIVTPNKTAVFGATILSNNYENGKGIIKFNGDVTKVGIQAFYYKCKTLTSITIPNSVTSIGAEAFRECSALESITIPNSVTSIGERAFYGCKALTSITIPNSVTSIGNDAFGCCKALESFYGKFASEDNRCLIIDGVLNSFAPAGLTSYTIPNSVTSIEEDTFSNYETLTGVIIPNSVISIGKQAFAYCYALESVTIGNGVTSIGENAFWSCRALTCVTIPDSVTSIGEDAFYYCKALTSVTIGNGVTSIGVGAFNDCDAITSVNISNLSAWCKIDFASVSANPMDNNKAGLYLNGELVTDLTIPSDITALKPFVFKGCNSITRVTIPNYITSIGKSAFKSCKVLKEVYCKPTTPPTADLGGNSSWDAFNNNASGRKIYVPAASVDAYKAADGWRDFADSIEPYEFTE